MWRYIVIAILFLYCAYYAATLDAWHFIDYVNLIIHEAGHLVFSLFGYFMTIAGGTILQLLVPIIFTGYFTLKQQYFSGSVLLFWLGLNLFNVSVYAGDAVKMQLPLLTGDKDTHDWNQLLFYTGQLRNTDEIRTIIFTLGVIAVFAALAWGIYAIRTEDKTINFD